MLNINRTSFEENSPHSNWSDFKISNKYIATKKGGKPWYDLFSDNKPCILMNQDLAPFLGAIYLVLLNSFKHFNMIFLFIGKNSSTLIWLLLSINEFSEILAIRGATWFSFIWDLIEMNQLTIDADITSFDGCLNKKNKEKGNYLAAPLVAPTRTYAFLK